MHTDLTIELMNFWKAQDLILPGGVSEAALRHFEEAYSVKIPSDMRDYLRAVNGMSGSVGNEEDSNFFRFLPLREFQPVPRFCEETGAWYRYRENIDKYFVFVDYMHWSYGYAIDLSGNSEDSQPVIHIGTRDEKTVSKTFSEFVRYYLQDATDIYLMP